MAIESMLRSMIGERGGALHTARSRNDQVALDERLYLAATVKRILGEIRKCQRAFVRLARRNSDVVMPGYTHLQRGQPVLLAHHLLAYVEMLERDRERFADARARIERSPLGAGALAGASFPIDRRMVARSLGMRGILENSIDAVSDRDVQIEFLSVCAITMMHLSRCAEELVIWSSREWHFAELGEAYTTGSSIMPQKRNPDMAELIRGKTGRVYGNLIALLTVMKGLPLAYNRDMQEDKVPLFDSADTLEQCLRILAGMLRTTQFNKLRFDEELKSDFLLATELADYLARKGVPFRKAHTIVGGIVLFCEQQRLGLADLRLKEYKRFSRKFDADLYLVLHPESSIASKRSEGSTAPRKVAKALLKWERKLRR
jgi:argininosuccinate lyase